MGGTSSTQRGPEERGCFYTRSSCGELPSPGPTFLDSLPSYPLPSPFSWRGRNRLNAWTTNMVSDMRLCQNISAVRPRQPYDVTRLASSRCWRNFWTTSSHWGTPHLLPPPSTTSHTRHDEIPTFTKFPPIFLT
jgi:hypothetical protein